MRKYKFFMIAIMVISLAACKSHKNGVNSVHGKDDKSGQLQKRMRLLHPADKAYIHPDSLVKFQMTVQNDSILVDSILISANGENLLKLTNNDCSADLSFSSFDPGEHRLSIRVHFRDSIKESYSVRLRILSDTEPAEYSYKVIRTYPHDIKAYTQGFEYEDGFIFEGTGNYGESDLRKYNMNTGEILKMRDLDSEFFGEGITRLNGKIYQITYKKQVGFVYDEESFDLIRKIFYQNKQGWGLCNDGQNIIMSDGSNIIYFMDTVYFSVEKRIEVYDNHKEVDMLNELELIDGILYANRYTTNEIVMIDPETGKIIGKIDMTGLLDPADRHQRIDYLNGIAADKKTGKIFLTGKRWPKIYEVKFIKK